MRRPPLPSPPPPHELPRDGSQPALIPRHRTLDGFLAAISQVDGIGVRSLDAFRALVVRTDNSVYRITILTPLTQHRGDVLVQGGPFFAGPTCASLNGSSGGGPV